MIPVAVSSQVLAGERDGRLWIAGEGETDWITDHEYAVIPPAWMQAAAKPCGAAECRGGEISYPEWEGVVEQCPDCKGTGATLIELRVECVALGWCGCGFGPDGCPVCAGDGTVSAGTWRLIDGPVRIVSDMAFIRGIRDDEVHYSLGGLAHLHDGSPSDLTGQWAAQIERVEAAG